MPKRFTYWILGGMILGIVVGYILHATLPDPKEAAIVAGYFSIITDLFLRLIKMIIAPLVFSMLWSASRIWATPRRSAGSGSRRWPGSSSPRWSRSRSAW
jgi:L-cystine uptake protein TcyP (sodium:dicarboxylate symporter family)